MPVFKTVSPAGLQQKILESNGKRAKNTSGSILAPFTVCSWTNAGGLVKASASNISADIFAGVTNDTIADNSFGLVLHSGKLPGALVGLNAVAGQPVFMSPVPGLMILDTSGFSSSDAIVRIGFAEPADGSLGVAVDLQIEFEIISMP